MKSKSLRGHKYRACIAVVESAFYPHFHAGTDVAVLRHIGWYRRASHLDDVPFAIACEDDESRVNVIFVPAASGGGPRVEFGGLCLGMREPLDVFSRRRSHYLACMSLCPGRVIPTEIGLLSRMTVLEVDDQDLIGKAAVCWRVRQKHQSLSYSSITRLGTIPTEIGRLTNLIQLGLNRNRLAGSAPAHYRVGTKSAIALTRDISLLKAHFRRRSGGWPGWDMWSSRTTS